ncbi:hypothetical protein CS542_00330 [Pedobacter sp. IW39]|nr:hypothetical protein CS542_00330 [Pedobacter sp. IW39]
MVRYRLEDYLDGKLGSKAMHKIEKQALEDPFDRHWQDCESRGKAVQNVSCFKNNCMSVSRSSR